MEQAICKNPDCKKVYNISDKEADTEFCSFECWEKIKCKVPPYIQFDKIELELE